MTNIFHNFPINCSIDRVFETISTPQGLDKWWTKTALGIAATGETFHLYFEPDYHWTGCVSKCTPNTEFELTMQSSDNDWEGTKVGFQLIGKSNLTEVQFYHIGWKQANEHYCTSNYCWAMYLRILKRNLELGEFIHYR